MRNGRELIAIGLLLLLFLGGGLLLGGRGSGAARVPAQEMSPDPSLSNDRASGSKGAFEWAGRLGYRAEPWRQPWDRLGQSEDGVLLAIDPGVQSPGATLTGGGEDKTQLGPADAGALRRWLSGGHTAILLTSRLAGGQGGQNGQNGQNGKNGSQNEDGNEDGDEDGPQTFGDALDLVAETASPPTSRTEFAPALPVRDTDGVLSVHSDSGSRLARDRPDALALFGDKAGPLALVIPVGKGRLVAVADAGLFSNASLPRSENAVFLADLLAHYGRPGGRVLFDEYHHGDTAGGAGGSVWETLGRPLQLALIQLGLAAAALVVLLSGRFGPPVPLGRSAARSSSDYVLSLASLYRRAGAAPTALETLYRQFLRDVCGRLGLPPDVSLERLAEVAARRGQVDRARMRGLLAACEQRLDAGKVTESELLDLTRQMDGIRKDIGIA